VPFDAGTFNQLMFKIVLSEVPPPETIVPDLDPAFSSIISKSMTRDLTQRFQSTGEFIQALDGWMRSGTAVTVPPAADAAAAGLALAGRPAMGSQTNINSGAGTSGNWASSQPHVEPQVPKKSSAGLLAALAIVGVVVMGGAAFAAYSVLGKKSEPTAASSASSQANVPGVPAAAALKADAEPKVDVAPTPPTPATAAPAQAPSAAPPEAGSAAPASGTDGSKAIAAARPLPAAKPGAAKPAPAGRPAAPAGKPAAPAGKPGGGTPDFGY
jgi:eukaryotic-like serine/threonine-protein kinase